jgi:glycosyltransferase involved in cell wall biosynthesis
MRAIFYPVGGRNTASSRYRAYVLADHLPEFEIGYLGDGRWRDFEAVVMQKQYFVPGRKLAKRARQTGKLVILDVSDALWIERVGDKGRVQAAAKQAHCLTCSNGGDASKLRAWVKDKPVKVMPNAQDLSSYRPISHRPKRKPVVVWSGYTANVSTLQVGCWPALRLLARQGVKFEVLLISNEPEVTKGLFIDDQHPVWFKPWRLSREQETLQRGDVFVNPQRLQADGLWHKDRNKSVTAWACGLAVVDFQTAGTSVNRWAKKLSALLTDHRERRKNANSGLSWSFQNHDVSVVAEKWLDLLQRMKEKKL